MTSSMRLRDPGLPASVTRLASRRPALTGRASVRVLVEREIGTRLRDRAFAISTGASLLLVVGIAVLPALFGGSPSTWKVGAVGAQASAAARLAVDVAPVEREAELTMFDDDAALRAAVADGTVDLGVASSGALLGDDGISAELETLVQAAWRQQALVAALTDAGVAADDANAIASAPPLPVALLDPPDDERDRRVGFLVVGVLLLYGQLIGYGFAVASGIVEEKSSRVIEVLLAKVRTRQLLVAKVVGIGLVGLVQLVALVVTGLVAFQLSGRFEMPPGTWPSALMLLGWFLVGFAMYAALFAVSGALAARVEDLQNSAGPITMVVAASFFGAVSASTDPAGTLAQVLSFVPTTGPMVMPIRVAAEEAAAWEIAASLAITLASVALVMRLADVVYRRAALHTSSRIGLRQVLRRPG
jgi:ABC-2 type transport system permease protein